MKTEKNSLESFQDLTLTYPESEYALIRQSLIDCAKHPWIHVDSNYSEDMKAMMVDGILFDRINDDSIPNARLFLVRDENMCKIANIVPLESGKINISEYNDILKDFLDSVVCPALQRHKFHVHTTKDRAILTDYMSQESAENLRRFSVLANKATGSSHPSDQDRWFDFILSVHRDSRAIDTSMLKRWLIEVERWGSDEALDLVIEYEFALELLRKYDMSFRGGSK